MGHEPVLIPDFTLIIQLAIFFASFFVMNSLIFKPYVALLNARREKTVGLKEKALADRDRALKLRNEHEAFMKAERKKIVEWTETERKKISEEDRRIVQQAREAVNEDLQVLRAKVNTDCEKARKELLPQVSEYSSQIASKLVGYKVNVSGTMDLGQHAETEHTVLQ